MPTDLRLKRAYDDPESADGLRILADRLWPRGLRRQEARIDLWAKELAPSTELRRWFGHDPAKWPEFQSRYRAELEGREAEAGALRARIGTGTATLVFAAKDSARNNAVVLRDFLLSGD